MIRKVNDHSATTAAYAPAFFSDLARAEDRHFWFRSRNRLIAGMTRQLIAGLPPKYRVLEMGCGNGNVLRHLARVCENGLTVGMDYFAEGLRIARRRTDCPLIQGDARRAPFRREFDLIGAFDVLEHISDDIQMLTDLRELLVPGGALLITVPAGKELWSHFDEASQHYRRYEEADLTDKLRTTGFEVQRLSPFMCSIYPLLWMSRWLSKREAKEASKDRLVTLAREEFRIVPVVNELLTAVLTLESSWVSRGGRLPFGTSLLAIARKPRAGNR